MNHSKKIILSLFVISVSMLTISSAHATPSISLSPSSDRIGTTVTVSGSGFAHSATITFTYDGSTVTTNPTTVRTDTSGYFCCPTFTVPTSSAAGPNTVQATDGLGDYATATFTATGVTQSITLSTTSVPVGSGVSVSGYGFAASSRITITYNNGASLVTSPTPITTTTSGYFCCPTFTVPPSSAILPSSAAGPNTVQATDGLGDYATATFTATGVTQSITLSPTSVPVGSGVSVSGYGFAASSPITFTYDGNIVTTNPTPVTTTVSGLLPYPTFVVPPSAFGDHTVRGTDASGNTASATFTVPCAPPTTGDWSISSNCVLSYSSSPPANVIVQSPAVLTIPAGLSLNIDFTKHYLLVKPGGGVLINPGGQIP